jgi:hypothetical protein
MLNTNATAELVSTVEGDEKLKPQPRLTQRDEADLEWFWCFGEATFERSTFGAILERQALYGEVTELCLTCDGYGSDRASGQRCVPCRGKGRIRIGQVELPSHDVLGSKACPECHTESGYRRKNADPSSCPVCEGTLYVDSAAVGMMAAAHGESGYEPDDGALRRYAKVSRRLSRLENQDRASAAVLQAYYGVDGLRWGGTDHGRLTALIPMTRAGARLLEHEENALGLGVRELFANFMLDQSRKRSAGQKESLMHATAEAGQLYVRACRAWNTTGSAS